MYLSSKTNWQTFNTYHSTLFKGSVSLIMDLKIGFLFRFSFDKDIHYCLGSIKKIHWYKIKSLLPWIFMSTKKAALISSIKEILSHYWGYLFINSDYFSSFSLLFKMTAANLWISLGLLYQSLFCMPKQPTHFN